MVKVFRKIKYGKRKFRYVRKFNYGKAAFRWLKRNVERRHKDFTISSSIASDSPVVTNVTAIAQGDSISARQGNKISVYALHGRFLYTGVDPNSYVRTLIVQDTQQIADTDAVISDVLSSNDITGMMELVTLGRFRIIRDFMTNLNLQATSTGRTSYKNLYIKFKKPIQVRYNSTATTDIQKNGIYVMQISNIASAAGEPMQSSQFRVSFTDS